MHGIWQWRNWSLRIVIGQVGEVIGRWKNLRMRMVIGQVSEGYGDGRTGG